MPVEKPVINRPYASQSGIASDYLWLFDYLTSLVTNRWLIELNGRMVAEPVRRPVRAAKGGSLMTVRSHLETVIFKHPFQIRGIDRVLPAGSYEVITDEEMIEGLSFAAFRRIATLIKIPAETGRAFEMISIGSVDLADAQRIDACTPLD
jgi:hypothetical protein